MTAESQQRTASFRKQLETKIQQGQLDLPMLPKVAGAVVSMTQDENSDMEGLANLIQGDPALATRVMKIANSPGYRGVNPMTSLQQAIARLGMVTIAEVALAASVGAKVFNVKGFNSELTLLWKHSNACSQWAKEIARLVRRNVESAFMCGLLHQIGKPVALQALVDLQSELDQQLEKQDLLALVDEFYIQVGSALGNSWQLPEAVIQSIEHHQDYHNTQSFGHEVLGTAGASFLADQLMQNKEIELVAALENDALAELNLFEDDIQKLVAKAPAILDQVEAMAL